MITLPELIFSFSFPEYLEKFTSMKNSKDDRYCLLQWQKEYQFFQWIDGLNYLNDSLKDKYDGIYMQMYSVKLYELLIDGKVYAVKMLEENQKSDNEIKTQLYTITNDGIEEILSHYSDDDFFRLQYYRHNSGHIFQNHYAQVEETNGLLNEKMKIQIKGKDGKKETYNFEEFQLKLNSVLFNGGQNAKANEKKHKIQKHIEVYPIIKKMYSDLCSVRNK